LTTSPGRTQRPTRRIATEEAFSIPEIAEKLREVARSPTDSSDVPLLRGIYDAPQDTPLLLEKLLDLADGRISEMDEHGVDMAVLSLSAPGVQMFDADTAVELATLANDRLAEVIDRHPGRFAGLASLAPHSPKRSVREMDRAINDLKLNGFIINSHTYGEYLDDPKFWPVLEAAEALGACIYIHPRGSGPAMAGAFGHYGLEGAVWSYGLEVSTHALRMIVSGVFDRFPDLKICLGHMGEAIHFWLWRIDFMNAAAQDRGTAPKLELKPSEYFRRNFVITTSGQESDLALEFSVKALGAENILWAIDHPYQPTAPAVAWMDAAPISDADRELIYHVNAERIFGIPPKQT
jgi:2,3-dihydroxybenzoate decarboxylase/5-carboxyvanillate decarboxylase